MKKKDGFTLIELLAVIVILAIIALIATPIVLNLIEKARQGSAKDSAYGVRKTAQLYYQTVLLDNIDGINDSITINFNNGNVTSSLSGDVEFNLDGTKPSGGSITITKNGEISGSVVINNYTCTIPSTGNITCEKGGSNNEEENTPTASEIEFNDTTIQGKIVELYNKLENL